MLVLLAVPRSGSTVTYQALVHALQPQYLSNLWNLLYAVPWFGGRVSARRCRAYQSDFRSNHGFVDGMCGPAEGLRFWWYWTGCGLDETPEWAASSERVERRVRYLRNVLTALTNPSCPMVSGYLGHALIIDRLRAWFPEAVFLRLHRDPLSNAASILRSRQRGSESWFSVFPRQCESVRGRGKHAEVAAQVYWLNRRLDRLEADERTVHVAYEELCQDPNGTLRRIVERCNAYGLDLSVRGDLPGSFEYRLTSPEENKDASLLWNELQRLEAKYGRLGVY